METSTLLERLNDAQRRAVSAAADQHLLVLAGAGSGKTRVLTHRMAWLCQQHHLSPYSLLAVTFTNKAAAEMRSRLGELLQMPVSGLWVGTFHGLAHRLLRLHWQEAGLPQNFQIIDSDDQLRLAKRIVKELGLDDKRWPPKQAVWFINARKEEGRRAAHLEAHGNPIEQGWIRIYLAYEAACQRGGQVDFAELLLRVVELLRDNDSLREHYQNRFSHLLVDEFQDSNELQYAWLRLLTGEHGTLFAVGDDDQSIYGWRGAKVANLLNFEQDLKGSEVIRLEQNYRSTALILKAANALISNNDNRLGKELWTAGEEGEPLTLYTAYDERDEARFVCQQVQNWVDNGGRRDEMAVLYRSNAQSRIFEEALISAVIPYRVYGGLRFFERAEIKDSLAYLRLLNNPHDDISFERAVNHPPRGIGVRTVEQIRLQAQQGQVSLWEATEQLLAAKTLKGRAASALAGFLTLMEQINTHCNGLDLGAQVEQVVEGSGLKIHFEKDRSDKGRARVENLQELVGAAGSFQGDAHAEMSPLDAFLAHAALEAGETQGGEWEDCLQLMTLHSAKGLEFPVVFMVGIEEGLFPHQRTLEEPKQLEEERRLCYVGITRARQQLYLCHAENRRLYGRELYPQPSRFLEELPAECLQELRPRLNVRRPVYRSAASNQAAAPTPRGRGQGVGKRVRHSKFGEGVVTDTEGQGDHARVQVNFATAGSKWLVLSYAKLEYL
ncbi:MAG: DNA helicase II [Gammaproteobacteria bacterium]|nr:DNA helicase II [Gammaproteobacteria bacterium]